MTPAVIAGASLGANAAGSLIQGLGAQESAQAQAQAYQYKAGVALLNKQINEQNANWAYATGDISAEEKGLQAGQEIAETKVQQAASGLDVNTGSAAAVRGSQVAASQFDQNLIRWEAAKTAYGYQTRAMGDVAEAGLDTAAASQAREAGNIAMVSSFLGGASSVSSKWLQGSQQGLWGAT